MSGKLKGIIKQLERGSELCGICGKDITGAPDCIHEQEFVFILLSETEGQMSRNANGRIVYIRKTLECERTRRRCSMRIGMELLLDIPYLASLRLCDPSTFRVTRDGRSKTLKQQLKEDT